MTSSDDKFVKLMMDRAVDNAVCGTLVVHGWEQEDLQDGLQETRMRTLRAFRRGVKPPETVGEMRALCAKIARDYAVDCLRRKDTAAKYCAGMCEYPDQVAPITPSGEQRDPVDASRQLEIVAEMFRRGEMPEHGAEILEGVASGCSYPEIGGDLGITDRAVEGRVRTMRAAFRGRMGERRMG